MGGGFGGHAGFGGGMGMGGRGMGFHAGPAFGGARFAGAPFAAHAAFTPGFARGAFGPRFGFHHGHFFHHRFNRFAFVGGPFFVGYGYDDYCWRRVWTSWGPHWVNVCYDSGWY
jgi:hypothetical protein